ncbi:MAG TPA: hypothetical protein VHB98_01515 [Chloroflexota bacterium]|nr:hypothetical protein [Chloroflexota bacterium]
MVPEQPGSTVLMPLPRTGQFLLMHSLADVVRGCAYTDGLSIIRKIGPQAVNRHYDLEPYFIDEL